MFTNFAHAGHDHSESESPADETTAATTDASQNSNTVAHDVIGLEFVIATFVLAVLLVIAAGFAVTKKPSKKQTKHDQ